VNIKLPTKALQGFLLQLKEEIIDW